MQQNRSDGCSGAALAGWETKKILWITWKVVGTPLVSVHMGGSMWEDNSSCAACKWIPRLHHSLIIKSMFNTSPPSICNIAVSIVPPPHRHRRDSRCSLCSLLCIHFKFIVWWIVIYLLLCCTASPLKCIPCSITLLPWIQSNVLFARIRGSPITFLLPGKAL